jgi:hypothetical protein
MGKVTVSDENGWKTCLTVSAYRVAMCAPKHGSKAATLPRGCGSQIGMMQHLQNLRTRVAAGRGTRTGTAAFASALSATFSRRLNARFDAEFNFRLNAQVNVPLTAELNQALTAALKPRVCAALAATLRARLDATLSPAFTAQLKAGLSP